MICWVVLLSGNSQMTQGIVIGNKNLLPYLTNGKNNDNFGKGQNAINQCIQNENTVVANIRSNIIILQ